MSVSYGGDVNGTGRIDINDAQYIYDLYNTNTPHLIWRSSSAAMSTVTAKLTSKTYEWLSACAALIS